MKNRKFIVISTLIVGLILLLYLNRPKIEISNIQFDGNPGQYTVSFDATNRTVKDISAPVVIRVYGSQLTGDGYSPSIIGEERIDLELSAKDTYSGEVVVLTMPLKKARRAEVQVVDK